MHIVDIESSVGSGSLASLSELQAAYGWPESMRRIFERYLRLRSACLHPDKTLAPVLRAPLERLVRAHPELVDDTDYVVYAHSLHATIAETGGEEALRGLAKDLFRCEPEVFSITQGACASGLLGLKLLRSMLGPGGRAVLITGEKCFHPTVQYVERHGVFGEAACAVYLSTRPTDRARASVLDVAVRTLGEMCAIQVSCDERRLADYDESFMATLVATVQQALAAVGLVAAQVDAIVPYHASPPTFDRLALALALPAEAVFRRNLFRLGHCFCGDAFINLNDLMAEQLRPLVVVAPAVGVSGTFCAAVIRIEPSDEDNQK